MEQEILKNIPSTSISSKGFDGKIRKLTTTVALASFLTACGEGSLNRDNNQVPLSSGSDVPTSPILKPPSTVEVPVLRMVDSINSPIVYGGVPESLIIDPNNDSFPVNFNISLPYSEKGNWRIRSNSGQEVMVNGSDSVSSYFFDIKRSDLLRSLDDYTLWTQLNIVAPDGTSKDFYIKVGIDSVPKLELSGDTPCITSLGEKDTNGGSIKGGYIAIDLGLIATDASSSPYSNPGDISQVPVKNEVFLQTLFTNTSITNNGIYSSQVTLNANKKIGNGQFSINTGDVVKMFNYQSEGFYNYPYQISLPVSVRDPIGNTREYILRIFASEKNTCNTFLAPSSTPYYNPTGSIKG